MAWDPPVLDHSLPLRRQLTEAGWRAVIEQIAEKHALLPCELEPYVMGETIVWRAGKQVIKLTTSECAFQIEAEVGCLSAVQGKLRLTTPRLHAHGKLSGWPYVIMDRIGGYPLAHFWPALGHEHRRRLARDLGSFCHELHALESRGFPSGWDAFWRTISTNVGSRHAAAGGPPALLAEIDAFLVKVGPLTADRLVPLHTELIDQHVYADERDAQVELSGLLDFADSRLGASHYDFSAPVEFIFKGERGLLREFLLGYGVPEAHLTPSHSEKLLGWSLCHRFGTLARTLALVEPQVPSSLEELAATLYSLAPS